MVQFLQVEPSFKAADLCLVGHELAEAMPGLVAVDLDEAGELFILLLGPMDLLSWCLANPCPLFGGADGTHVLSLMLVVDYSIELPKLFNQVLWPRFQNLNLRKIF